MTRAKRSRGIGTIAVLATVGATMVIGVALLIWMQESSGSYVFDRTKEFSEMMRVVRPALLLLAMLLWRPIFGALHQWSIIADSTHEVAHSFWPKLTIWTALIELTLGQGFVLLGLSATATYWFYLRNR